MKRISLLFLFFSFLGISSASAGESGSWRQEVADVFSNIWKSDRHQLIIPLNTFHVRSTYDKEKIAKYNEMPWGLGVERYYVSQSGITHSIYGVVFKDSHNQFSPTFGYNWEKKWPLTADGDWSVGAGFTTLLTFRKKEDYIPIPGIIPLLSVGYKRVTFQTVWIPHMGHNHGNIFFSMMKWSF